MTEQLARRPRRQKGGRRRCPWPGADTTMKKLHQPCDKCDKRIPHAGLPAAWAGRSRRADLKLKHIARRTGKSGRDYLFFVTQDGRPCAIDLTTNQEVVAKYAAADCGEPYSNRREWGYGHTRIMVRNVIRRRKAALVP